MKMLLGILAGMLIGALAGAFVLGMTTYLDRKSSFIGPNHKWAGAMAIIGAILGLLPGALTGLGVILTNSRPLAGLAIGAGIGTILAVYVVGTISSLNHNVRLFSGFVVPTFAVAGLAVALIMR